MSIQSWSGWPGKDLVEPALPLGDSVSGLCEVQGGGLGLPCVWGACWRDLGSNPIIELCVSLGPVVAPLCPQSDKAGRGLAPGRRLAGLASSLPVAWLSPQKLRCDFEILEVPWKNSSQLLKHNCVQL